MNKILFISFFIFLFSCNSENTKLIRKKIDNKDIIIKWYFYSYISNNSPDIVTVEKNGDKKEIYKATGVILDVALQNNNIILKLVSPSENLVFTKELEKKVFGYNIVLDTTGNYGELRLRPDGVKDEK